MNAFVPTDDPTALLDPSLLAIARVCYEANRAYCVTVDDPSQQAWDQAHDWQRASVYQGVRKIANGAITKPEQSHESWVAHMLADGWVYGESKSVEAKTHPCLVPFDLLPPHQQTKDYLFFAVATTLLGIVVHQPGEQSP